MRRQEVPIKFCKYCNNPIIRKQGQCPSGYNKRQFCSSRCAMKYRCGVDKINYICEYCGKKITTYASNKRGDHVFCSRDCYGKSQRRTEYPKCNICGKPVTEGRNLYCSRTCRGIADRTGSNVSCAICGKIFYMPINRIKKTQNFYCSAKCHKVGKHTQIAKARLALRLKRLNNEPTLPETLVMQMLDSLNVLYEHEVSIGRYYIDFVVTNLPVCIEVDGDYWHGNKKTDKYIGNKQQLDAINRDKRKDKFLKSKGYTVLRLWESDIKKDSETVLQHIQETINDYNQTAI